MKKKLAAAVGILAVAVLMVFLPPPEWAGAQNSGAAQASQPTALRVCFRYLEHGQFRNFGACVANLAKRGEL